MESGNNSSLPVCSEQSVYTWWLCWECPRGCENGGNGTTYIFTRIVKSGLFETRKLATASSMPLEHSWTRISFFHGFGRAWFIIYTIFPAVSSHIRFTKHVWLTFYIRMNIQVPSELSSRSGFYLRIDKTFVARVSSLGNLTPQSSGKRLR